MHPIIHRLERQRRGTSGRVFALIADPRRVIRRIIVDYVARLQRRYTPLGQAAVFTATPADRHIFRKIPHVKFFSGRRPDSIRGQTFQQIIIDSVDLYTPSVPYYRGPLTRLPYACFPTLPDTGGVMIILGDPFRPGHNHYRRYWKQMAASEAFLLIDPHTLAEQAAERRRTLTAIRAARSAKLSHRSTLKTQPSRLQTYTFLFYAAETSTQKTSDLILPKIPTSAPRLRA